MLHRSQLQIGLDGLDLGFFQFQQLGSGQLYRTKACAPQRNFMVEGEDRPTETTWKAPVKTCFFLRSELRTLVLRTCLLVEQSSQILDQYLYQICQEIDE